MKRRDKLITGLKETGLEVYPCLSTFYVWAKTPKPYSSIEYSSHLLNQLGIVTTPGNGFGAEGEGYFRFSLTISDEKIDEAVSRLKTLK